MARLALPTVATMTSYTLMTFVDKWLVAQLGPDYVGAHGNGGLAAWLPISLAHGGLMIVNTFVAQNLGAGRPDRGPAYCWNGIWLGSLYWVAVLIPLAVALPYLFDSLAAPVQGAMGLDPAQARLAATYGSILLYGAGLSLATRCVSQFFFGMHRPGVVLTAGVLANLLNVYLSAVLVFGNAPPLPALGWLGAAAHWTASALFIPPMGIAGSALGTVIATAVELALPLAVFLGPRFNAQCRTRAAWRPSLAHVRDILRLGTPAGVMFANEMICWTFFMVYLVSRFGRLHAAAGWIAHQYMALSFMPAVGISVAVTALVGRYQGMGRTDLAAGRAWLGVKIAAVYMGLCGAVFVLFPRPLLTLFIAHDTPPEDVTQLVRLGTAMLLATATFQLFDAIAMVLSGALRGAGDTLIPGIATVVCAWIIIVGGGLFMVRQFPSLESIGAWIAVAAYIAILCTILAVRFLSGRWKHIRLVHPDDRVVVTTVPDPAS
jgi:MATE family multidrug resistance protein